MSGLLDETQSGRRQQWKKCERCCGKSLKTSGIRAYFYILLEQVRIHTRTWNLGQRTCMLGASTMPSGEKAQAEQLNQAAAAVQQRSS